MAVQKRNRTKGKAASRRRQARMKKYMKIGLICLVMVFMVLGVLKIVKPDIFAGKYRERIGEHIDAAKPEINVQLLTVNPYSRPGTETNKITGIVVHYTANPGATAMNNRDYFESQKDNHENQVSSNFVVGLEGEIVQCVPTWEVAYASNSRNIDTVSIECCHPDESGEFTQATYDSLVKLTAWLCDELKISRKHVIRHYDVTGKSCPKYFVENEDAWKRFKKDIGWTLEDFEKSSAE